MHHVFTDFAVKTLNTTIYAKYFVEWTLFRKMYFVAQPYEQCCKQASNHKSVTALSSLTLSTHV